MGPVEAVLRDGHDVAAIVSPGDSDIDGVWITWLDFPNAIPEAQPSIPPEAA